MRYAVTVLREGTRPVEVLDNAANTLVLEVHRLAGVVGVESADATGLAEDASTLIAQIGRMLDQVRREVDGGFGPSGPSRLPHIVGRLSIACELLLGRRCHTAAWAVPCEWAPASGPVMPAVPRARRGPRGVVAAALRLIVGPMLR